MPPSWDQLYEIAVCHAGHFTTADAATAGYSPQLLAKHIKAGRISRVRRGIYRLVHYPIDDGDQLAVLWLWSARTGVFSHETALTLHDLSDVLPSRVHMTLPASWRARRLRVPAILILTYADIPDGERTWHGSVPITKPARTLQDCAATHVAPQFLEQAIREGLARGLFTPGDIAPVREHLAAIAKASAAADAINAELTIRQAADLLDVPRADLEQLLDKGRIASRRVGGERRILVDDLLAFKQADDIHVASHLETNDPHGGAVRQDDP